MNTLKHYTITGTVFVCITGMISHFIYEWSDQNFILGFLVPVNESTWEHMKLCFFPMLLFSVYMCRKLKPDYSSVTAAMLYGILTGTLLIPFSFYTYSGILGRNCLPLDIAIFILSVALAFVTVYRLTLSRRMNPRPFPPGLCVLVLAICFVLFTYNPPNLGIFADPTK